MKAQRRHELQTNTLADFLSNVPLYLRFHANKILIGAIVIALLVLLIRHRMNQAVEARQAVRNAIAQAIQSIDTFPNVDRQASTDTARIQDRKRVITEVNAALDGVMADTSDPADSLLRADAVRARGDLNWMLASLPAIPGAATQPALAMPQSNEQYLEEAARNYQRVLSEYNSQKVPKAGALFGLAAIEENRGNWDKATEHYRAVLADETIAHPFKDIARLRISMIPQLKVPVFLGTFASTLPSTQPTTEPTTLPLLVPQATTLPAIPGAATSPASRLSL